MEDAGAIKASRRAIDRELSWLEFNARVLHEAFDGRNPLLERLKFLAIFSTNIDEFYMVRVAGLRRDALAGNSGVTARLAAVKRRAAELAARQRVCVHDILLPALAEHGIRVLRADELTPAQWHQLDEKFETEILPAMNPAPLEAGSPIANMPNLSVAIAARLRNPRDGATQLAAIKIPRSVHRLLRVRGAGHLFVPLEAMVAAHATTLFPGMELIGWSAFRVIRWSEAELAGGDAADPLALFEERVFRKRFAEPVRIEVEDGTPGDVRARLRDVFDSVVDPDAAVPSLEAADVVEAGPLLGLGELLGLAALDVPALRDPPFSGAVPEEFAAAGGGNPGSAVFDAIRGRDLLVHHPFQSFAATVEQFIETAAADDAVTAIKMTLYRTSGSTRIVRALTEAAQRGKDVVAIVELQARFDEAKNITWARTLEHAGVTVTHGPSDLKTHAKLALITRSESGRDRTYVHLGTGNYNARTARVYTDIGMFTCDPEIGADVSALFETLAGENEGPAFQSLLVAPFNLRPKVLELIANEAARGEAGKIVAKMNALVDSEVIEALYAASAAGVEIDLLVRGTCALRPGVAGLSERIRVVSIVGRFLEHSRVWCLGNGGDPRYYIGSADWMERNLDRRVEVITPVRDQRLKARLLSLLETYLRDNRNAWDLLPDGSYVQRLPGTAGERSSHAELMRNPWGRGGVSETPA